jgi:nucleotide-binding universal stress UspA family protein
MMSGFLRVRNVVSLAFGRRIQYAIGVFAFLPVINAVSNTQLRSFSDIKAVASLLSFHRVHIVVAFFVVKLFVANFSKELLLMLQIIVATDFSEVADNALRYACQLAKDVNASVTVVHSFIIPVTFSDTPMPVMPLDEGREIAEDRMKEVVTGLQSRFSDIQLDSKIMFGDIIDSIRELAEEVNPWLVILGNSGNGNAPLWLGSNVLSGLKNLESPVLAIPLEVQYRKPEKICFACDFQNVASGLPATDILKLIAETKAELHVLTVDFENRSVNATTIFENTELHHTLKSLQPVYHYVEKESVEDGINGFLADNQMDWLMIMPHKHSFFEWLFHKSHTKAIMKTVQIPLIAIHEK